MVQICNRIYRRFWRPRLYDATSVPSLRVAHGRMVRVAVSGKWQTTTNSFTFLNESYACKSYSDWNAPSRDKLWLYNLHYFDDLRRGDHAQYVLDHNQLMHRWIRENPIGHGNGWEPYPSSLRIVNWVRWALDHPAEFDQELASSLVIQSQFLSQQIEYHLLGNHLLANAKAMWFAGHFFNGNQANGWLRLACKILSTQIPEQILEDGAHFERSPMYHHLIVEDLLDMIAITQVLTPPTYEKQQRDAVLCMLLNRAPSMLSWAKQFSRPSGTPAYFNDSVDGIVTSLSSLECYARKLDIVASATSNSASTYSQPSGFARIAENEWLCLIDAGSVQPSYIPGHAHAETLALELFYGGAPVFVNTGISTYNECERRQHERSTRAHNTFCVNGRNSSDVWRSFRVGQRAVVDDVKFEVGAQNAVLHASHDGYLRQGVAGRHTRRVAVGESVVIVDEISHGDNATCEGCWLVHPDVVVTSFTDLEVQMVLANSARLRFVVDSGAITVHHGKYAESFNVLRDSTQLYWRPTNTTRHTKVRYELSAL
jgi:uncharacterized heparinase superfamily protein